jgi:hypothetical protein
VKKVRISTFSRDRRALAMVAEHPGALVRDAARGVDIDKRVLCYDLWRFPRAR